MEVKVSSSKILKQFTYVLISRNKIIEAETVSVPENESNSHIFTFTTDNSMTPALVILIYIVENDDIWSKKLAVDLKGEFTNSVELSLSKHEARSGDEIDVNVETGSKSYVGLLGLDKNLLSLEQGNDLDAKEILREMHDNFWRTYSSHEAHSEHLNNWRDFKVISNGSTWLKINKNLAA